MNYVDQWFELVGVCDERCAVRLARIVATECDRAHLITEDEYQSRLARGAPIAPTFSIPLEALLLFPRRTGDDLPL